MKNAALLRGVFILTTQGDSPTFRGPRFGLQAEPFESPLARNARFLQR
ncbi:hypothetical protein [Noviherbaspirillum sedimenti]|nr:hypothetical protein [Noviherbaspirillum sedimenti]